MHSIVCIFTRQYSRWSIKYVSGRTATALACTNNPCVAIIAAVPLGISISLPTYSRCGAGPAKRMRPLESLGLGGGVVVENVVETVDGVVIGIVVGTVAGLVIVGFSVVGRVTDGSAVEAVVGLVIGFFVVGLAVEGCVLVGAKVEIVMDVVVGKIVCLVVVELLMLIIGMVVAFVVE